MLRITLPSLVVFQNPNLPRMLKHMTPSHVELTLITIKERKKKIRYLGSAFQHSSDSVLMYSAQGHLRRGTRFIIEQHHTRAQFVHPGRGRNSVDIRSIKMAGAQFDQMGNYTRTTWDQQLCTTNLLNDPTFKHFFKGIEKDMAIEMMEEWGVRYVLLDEVRKPSLVDCKYHKHHLFADKFSWSPEPETNYFRGDAEYKWKGDELIEYADYNAHVKHPSSFTPIAAPAGSKGAASKVSPWFARTMTPASAKAVDATQTASNMASEGKTPAATTIK